MRASSNLFMLKINEVKIYYDCLYNYILILN